LISFLQYPVATCVIQCTQKDINCLSDESDAFIIKESEKSYWLLFQGQWINFIVDDMVDKRDGTCPLIRFTSLLDTV